MYANARSRKHSKTRSKSRTSAVHKGWKKVNGKWVKVGSSKARSGAKTRKSYSKPAAKRTGKKSWPKKGSAKMKHVVAGVEARTGEDMLKALRLLKSVKYRAKATGRRAGVRGAGIIALDRVVKSLEKLVSKL